MALRRRVLADITPLRVSREYRLLWCGQLVNFLGTQLTVVAVPFQVYLLTRSSLDVGLVSLSQLVPLVLGSLLGGSVADAFDRRKVLLCTQVLLAGMSAGLALNAGSRHPALWPLFVLTSVAAGFSGIDAPTRSAVVPNLLDRASLPAAYALWQILIQTGQVAGPAAAGLLVGHLGLAAVYWIDVSTFAVAFAAVFALPPLPPHGGGQKMGFRSIGEGLRYLRGRQALQGTFVVDLNAMIFGMPRALFPALGTRYFGGGASTVGLLYAAPGAGALVGALLTGWVSQVRRQGRAVVAAVMVWGAAIALFGVSRWLPIALLLLGVAGAADVVSAVFRNTILQLTVPDALRGRLSAVHIAVVTGGPRLGDAEAGAVAALAGNQFSVVSGGLACLAGALVVARLMPAFARYTPPEQPDEPDEPDEPEELDASR